MAAERTTKLDFVSDRRDIVEERRNFAIRQALDSELDRRERVCRRRNRVTPHRTVATGAVSRDIDVLPCDVRERFAQPKEEALDTGVCWTISSITHDCHAICAPFSVIGVALLAPRIAIDVIAAQFPELRLVTRCELQRVHPFGGLPEVKVRNQKTRRPP